MKKAITMTLTATLAMSAFTAPLAFAQDKEKPAAKEEVTEEVATNFIQLTGKLGKIEKLASGAQMTTIQQGENVFSLTIDEQTIVLDSKGNKAELKEGAAFTAYVNKNKPMLAIYPPRYTPEVIIVEAADFGIAEIGTFDKNYVNKQNTLKLNLAKETAITDLQGNKLKAEDMIGKESLVFYGPATFSIPAQTSPYKVLVLEEEAAPQPEEVVAPFLELTGKVSDVVTRENGSQLAVIEDKDNPFAVAIDKTTVVLDNTGKKVELKKGAEITIYVDGNKPAILIYPPQYSPEVVIVHTEAAGTVEAGTFNQDFVNTENTLKLTIAENTKITNVAGDKLTKEDIVGNEALVFYTVATASIPAQTTPSQVIVLAQKTVGVEPVVQILDVLPAIIAHDHHDVNGVTMVPLRILAEELGFTVSSTGNGATLTKGDQSYTLTRGQKEYTHNGVVKSFEEAPALLEKNKTYVTQDFIYSLRAGE
ncbi:copper amine oxidase N-terminal domain-containing protein [Lysinibacillus piscis]|uniref:Copper amine oxidase-like N-terminal domain-containing protein n=1 Tax=Lysinibacillus piscis TaxID=2518931 RepID=A0ABQ5NFF1_9BACI|nr:copper amine oxidase N-terminal domain-containing protein [Lysinibacillus sp. KH24]GLC86978.1 hypothetical protein LYSBPC_01050 [Lysinibacillus sp. KH24]